MKILRNALLIFTVSAMLLTAVSCGEKPVLNIEFETLKSNTEIAESINYLAITDEEKDSLSKTLTELFRIYSSYSEEEFTEHLGFSKDEAFSLIDRNLKALYNNVFKANDKNKMISLSENGKYYTDLCTKLAESMVSEDYAEFVSFLLHRVQDEKEREKIYNIIKGRFNKYTTREHEMKNGMHLLTLDDFSVLVLSDNTKNFIVTDATALEYNPLICFEDTFILTSYSRHFQVVYYCDLRDESFGIYNSSPDTKTILEWNGETFYDDITYNAGGFSQEVLEINGDEVLIKYDVVYNFSSEDMAKRPNIGEAAGGKGKYIFNMKTHEKTKVE